jgi:hypothetical protein
MKIETKYNIGDEVWFYNMDYAWLEKQKIINIKVELIKGCPDIRYKTEYSGWFSESHIFKSKEDFIKSLDNHEKNNHR